MPATTAQLRAAAWQAGERGRLEKAARLYDLAADRYPGHPAKNGSALGLADVAGLREMAARMRALPAQLEAERPRVRALIERLKAGPARGES
jgi:hypothetical protein